MPRRFTIRSIFVAIAVIAWLVSWQTKQLRVAGQLRAAEVSLEYQFQFDDWHDEERYSRHGRAAVPLQVKLLGPDLGSNVVKLRSTRSGDPSHVAMLASQLPSLRTIAIQDCSLKDGDLHCFVDLQNLRGLHLRGTQITDGAVATLQELRHLRVLNVTNTVLSDSAIESLKDALPETRVHTGPSLNGFM